MPLLITEFSGRARCIIKVSSAEETWRLLADIIALAQARKRAKSRRLPRRPPAVSSSTFEAPFEAFLFSHLSRSSVSRILLHCVSSLSLVRSPSRLSIHGFSLFSLFLSLPPCLFSFHIWFTVYPCSHCPNHSIFLALFSYVSSCGSFLLPLSTTFFLLSPRLSDYRLLLFSVLVSLSLVFLARKLGSLAELSQSDPAGCGLSFPPGSA